MLNTAYNGSSVLAIKVAEAPKCAKKATIQHVCTDLTTHGETEGNITNVPDSDTAHGSPCEIKNEKNK